MAPRATWKGHLKLALVSCPVALYTAASKSDRIAFNTLNRDTGDRVKREFVDSETGDVVEREDQVKGYEIGKDDYVILTPEEVEAASPESHKTIDIQTFVPISKVDALFFDSPYYLAPSEPLGREAFGAIRDGMLGKKVAAIARAVLFRRERAVLIRPEPPGLLAWTLHYDYEVADAADAFDDIPELDISDEMLDLAEHIIDTKRGPFEPAAYEDRYEAALVELIRAKQEGRPVPRAPKPRPAKSVDLLDALRRSAGTERRKGGRKAAASKPPARKAAPKRKKAG